MAWQDTIMLNSHHSLILPHVGLVGPGGIDVGKLAQTHSPTMDIGSFGLFDTAAPNFSTYYPSVTAKDFNPAEDEFIYPVYRALSEVIVHRGWNPVDFSKNNVLKNSMNLLLGQTVYPNHENSVGNELGAIPEVFWEEAYSSKGVRIPAGINARLKLDAKSNPKIARAINMTPPSVHSTSVTVVFLWEKSHATMTEEEFWRGLGKFDKDGNMIRRIATAINRYNEISLVTKGADPFAQKVGPNGKINNPTEAGVRDEQKQKLSEKVFFFDYQTDLTKLKYRGESDLIGLQENTIPAELFNNDQNDNNMNKTFLLALAQVMGLTGEAFSEANITEDAIKQEVTVLAQQKAILAKFKELGLTVEKVEDVQALNDIIVKYNAIKDKDITKLEEFKTKTLEELREKVKGIYIKLNAKPNDEILLMIQNAGVEVLKGLSQTYQTQLEEKFPLTCTDCGSHAVGRGSAQASETKPPASTGASDKKDEKKLSLDEVIANKKSENRLGANF